MTTYCKLNSAYRLMKNVRNFTTKIQDNSEKWNSVIGLEIHAQISSDSKLFSGASTSFGQPVNTCVSLFDCAIPGTLPVLNKKCVEAGVLTALALSCQVNEVSFFDRKHYFYADLPAGYQITQQRQPLAVGGELQFNVFTPGFHKNGYVKCSKIKQIQLEQDSGKSLHDELGGRSLVDLNRAGVPLMELVFEPDLSDGEEAAALVKELINILQRLKTCSCKMEEGALRVDANISLHKPNEPLGVRSEIKNIGSVRALANAITYEIHRQEKLLNNGQIIINETLAWDAENQKTVPMRDKEEKQDYRFMPEPNLPPLRLHMNNDCDNKYNLVDVNSIAKLIPRLPHEIREHFANNLGLTAHAATSVVNNVLLTKLFEDIIKEDANRNPQSVANILINKLLEFLNKNKIDLTNPIMTSKKIGQLIDLISDRTINFDLIDKVLTIMINEPSKMPSEIVAEHNMEQINNDFMLKKIAMDILHENPKMVNDYKKGKKKVLRAILKAVCKKTDNRANMKKMTDIMEKILE